MSFAVGQRIKYTAKSNGQEYAGSVVAKRGTGYVLNLDVGKVKEVDSSDVWRIVSEGASMAQAATAYQPTVVAAPAASYVAPAPAVFPAGSSPAVTLAAPAVSFAAPPAVSYAAPAATYAPVSYAAPPAAPRLESLAPASSYVLPTVVAAPAASYVAPAPVVSPAVTLAAPAVSFAAPPAVSYAAPAASYAPVSYGAPPAAPRLESLAPASSYATPVVEYVAPATSFAVTGSPYGAPMPLAAPVQYGQPGTVADQAYASPVYTHPYPTAYQESYPAYQMVAVGQPEEEKWFGQSLFESIFG